ncbi:hypothetical protein BDZ90DRAFT_221785 [Jaminaea rosea]|uniref:GST C-terminal domain-containing protein n=1 Tax=Jaminaea rosea TaxID=1569628 RepID=A0A316UU03_9BASI|nr:hypothetical protein BDZ90DRAFT_221785 [Jaminaea rosea]PWN26575.1 hypothetical protein BDZ90DRAFT_221785 [Jaminaea rosea]
MTSATPQSKAVLYSFPGSVWASVPRLCLVEKGYEAHDVEIKTVNLLLGENFSPAYLRINPKATLPTLVVPLAETMSSEMDTKFRAITSTREVLKFLDQSRSAHILDQRGENATANPAPVLAPATVEGNAIAEKFLEMVHGMEADPNFLLLAAKSPEDVKKQAGAMQGTFVKNRHAALQKYRSEAASSSSSTENPRTQQQSAALIKWYDDKLAEEKPLVDAYIRGDAQAIAGLAAAGQKAWQHVPVVLDAIEAELAGQGAAAGDSAAAAASGSAGGPYLLGGQLSLVDLHVGAWLARILAVAEGMAGGAKGIDALKQILAQESGNKGVGARTEAYWKALMGRPSFQEVYKDGLH